MCDRCKKQEDFLRVSLDFMKNYAIKNNMESADILVITAAIATSITELMAQEEALLQPEVDIESEEHNENDFIEMPLYHNRKEKIN